jgi:hypothetical protein
MGSFGQSSGKKLTAYQRLHQIPHAIPPGRTRIEHGLDFRAICEAHGCPRRMQHEVFEEAFGELARVGGELAFDVVDVVEGIAAGQLA